MSSNNATPTKPTVLFTPERREQIYINLLTFLKTDDNIMGVVVVGSATTGYRDHYSGIDLMVVMKQAVHVTDALHKWRARLETLYTTVAHFEDTSRLDYAHYTVLLDNFLLIDIQFVTLSHLRKEIPPYIVAFDTGNEIEQTLAHEPNEPIHHTPQTTYMQIMQAAWQPMIKGLISVKREDIWRAIYMLEMVRDYTVELAGLRYDLDVRSFHDADQLPEMFLVHLRHTLPTSISQVAIKRALRTAIHMFFGEAAALDERFGQKISSSLEQSVTTFMEAYG